MVLSVNSSSTKVFVGFTAFGALALATVLFYRSRENILGQPTAPSLSQKTSALDVSFIYDIPVIGWAANYFSPINKAPLKSFVQPIPLCIGTSQSPIDSVSSLAKQLSVIGKQHQTSDILIIYGKTLKIAEDPGILALNPKKLILVGVSINVSSNLEQSMAKNGWRHTSNNTLTVTNVSSVEEALKETILISHSTSKPLPRVYSVQV